MSSVSQPASPQALLLAVQDLLSREIALDDLVRMLVDQIVAGLHADRGTLYLLDPGKQELFSKAAHLPELKEIRLRVGQGLAGHVAASGEPLNVRSTRDELRFFGGIDQQTGYTSRSLMAVPLRDRRGHIFGVVQVLNKKGGSFSRDDLSTLELLAEQAAQALEATSLYQELRRAEGDPSGRVSYHYNRVIGDGDAMRALYRRIDKVAPTQATVLIRGESGTGKEVIARALQINSLRRDKPFIKVDCAALPEALIENELFGHERGAFTGAHQRSIGKVEAAHGGTLFIDELGELPLSVQSKLLRILQDREFERIGGTETVRVDVRILAATHRDLEKLVEEGRFRADLYYRVKVVELILPPLRARGSEDIRRLVQHFATQSAQRHGRPLPRFTPAALERLSQYPWPGNVRELEHCIESAVVLCDSVVDEDELALPRKKNEQGPASAELSSVLSRTHAQEVPLIPSNRSPEPLGQPPEGEPNQPILTLAEVERRHILAVLTRAEGNQSLAARWLGVGRNTLARKLKEFEGTGAPPPPEGDRSPDAND